MAMRACVQAQKLAYTAKEQVGQHSDFKERPINNNTQLFCRKYCNETLKVTEKKIRIIRELHEKYNHEFC